MPVSENMCTLRRNTVKEIVREYAAKAAKEWVESKGKSIQLSTLTKPIKTLSKQKGYQILKIDQRSIVTALEDLGYHITKPHNKYQVLI